MKRFLKVWIIILVLVELSFNLTSQIQIPFNSEFRYLKGSDAITLPENWNQLLFKDKLWNRGNAPFRLGEGIEGTELSDMRYNYSTLYLRKSFVVNDTSNLKYIEIQADYDDGFILWMNGNQVGSYNAPKQPTYTSVAPSYREAGPILKFFINPKDVNLVPGKNIIAIQCFNQYLDGSDFYFDISVTALPDIAGNPQINFSHQAGFYSSPFELIVTNEDTSYTMLYTLDGSTPESSLTSFSSKSPLVIQVNPDNQTGRGKTPAFIVRASLYKSGYNPTKPVTNTYIFLDNVKTQKYPGGSWPSNVNDQYYYYPMHQYIVNSPVYGPLINDALLALPSISISAGYLDLFGVGGIYSHARKRGPEWERECSVELINPDNTRQFMVNAGLRIRGGASREGSNPKHSFRLFFKEQYGMAKQEYPWFGDEGASTFDKMDLRTAQNYAWNSTESAKLRNTFLRDIYSRDVQRESGQPYSRGRFYHLYLNGMYWGIYQTDERTEAHYAESYFGGKAEDYDVIKVTPEKFPYKTELADGNYDAWREIYNMCQQGFRTNADYFRLEGKDGYGNPVKGSRVWVDIDNLIDYMMIIFYTGNFDAPTSSFDGNKMPNNYYAILNRNNKGKGFVFLTHDSEHSMMIEPVYACSGLDEDRVNIANRNDWYKMQVATLEDFHPQWLHYKLSNIKEYRVRFADKTYKYLNDGGLFTPASVEKLLRSRMDEIDTAIIAESARWGGAYANPPLNKETWLTEVNKILTQFIPQRTDIVKQQLLTAGLYPKYSAPVVSAFDTLITESNYRLTNPISIHLTNQNSEGTIYYTLNGSDPRYTGGSVSPDALTATNAMDITISSSLIFNARIKAGTEWSALKQINFINSTEDFSYLKITEINYHPMDYINGTDTINGKDLEFIEMKNTGSAAINISGIKFDSAVSYTVPSNILLAPGGFYVIASKPSDFYAFYGVYPSGNFSRNLSNGGEQILLTDSQGSEIFSVTYDDAAPWPAQADGEGYTLAAKEINPTGDPGSSDYWRSSYMMFGSPFADDIFTSNFDILSRSKPEIYPNPVSDNLIISLPDIDLSANSSVKIYSRYGNLIFNRRIADNATIIDMQSLNIPGGMYIIELNIDGHIYTEKILYFTR